MTSVANQPETLLFLEYLDQWMQALPIKAFKEYVVEPGKTAIISVEIGRASCRERV